MTVFYSEFCLAIKQKKKSKQWKLIKQQNYSRLQEQTGGPSSSKTLNFFQFSTMMIS